MIASMSSIVNSFVSRSICLLTGSLPFTEHVFLTGLPQTSSYMTPIYHMPIREVLILV